MRRTSAVAAYNPETNFSTRCSLPFSVVTGRNVAIRARWRAHPSPALAIVPNKLFITAYGGKNDGCKFDLACPAGLEPATSWFVAVNTFVEPAQLTSLEPVSRVATWTQSWTQVLMNQKRPLADLSKKRRLERWRDEEMGSASWRLNFRPNGLKSSRHLGASVDTQNRPLMDT